MSQAEFYELYDVRRQFGWTPSIVNMLGGVSTVDSYTPLSAARYTSEAMRKYYQRPTGREATTQELVDYLYKTADRQGIDRDIAYRQIERESNFNPRARSSKGAEGIAQFMPGTAADYGLTDRTDPYASIDAWGRYMRDLLDLHGGDYGKALASYNWGQGRVLEAVKRWGESWLSKAPKETRDYVAAILGNDGWIEETVWIDANGNIVEPGTPGATPNVIKSRDAGIGAGIRLPNIEGGAGCSTFDVACHLESFFTGDTAKDLGKRLGLVLLAVVLLAVAIVSLR